MLRLISFHYTGQKRTARHGLKVPVLWLLLFSTSSPNPPLLARSIPGLLTFLIFLRYLNRGHSLRALHSKPLDSSPKKGGEDLSKVRLVENVDMHCLGPRGCQEVAEGSVDRAWM